MERSSNNSSLTFITETCIFWSLFFLKICNCLNIFSNVPRWNIKIAQVTVDHIALYQIFTTKISVRNITSLHISKQARFGEFWWFIDWLLLRLRSFFIYLLFYEYPLQYADVWGKSDIENVIFLAGVFVLSQYAISKITFNHENKTSLFELV